MKIISLSDHSPLGMVVGVDNVRKPSNEFDRGQLLPAIDTPNSFGAAVCSSSPQISAATSGTKQKLLNSMNNVASYNLNLNNNNNNNTYNNGSMVANNGFPEEVGLHLQNHRMEMLFLERKRVRSSQDGKLVTKDYTKRVAAGIQEPERQLLCDDFKLEKRFSDKGVIEQQQHVQQRQIPSPSPATRVIPKDNSSNIHHSDLRTFLEGFQPCIELQIENNNNTAKSEFESSFRTVKNNALIAAGKKTRAYSLSNNLIDSPWNQQHMLPFPNRIPSSKSSFKQYPQSNRCSKEFVSITRNTGGYRSVADAYLNSDNMTTNSAGNSSHIDLSSIITKGAANILNGNAGNSTLRDPTTIHNERMRSKSQSQSENKNMQALILNKQSRNSSSEQVKQAVTLLATSTLDAVQQQSNSQQIKTNPTSLVPSSSKSNRNGISKKTQIYFPDIFKLSSKEQAKRSLAQVNHNNNNNNSNTPINLVRLKENEQPMELKPEVRITTEQQKQDELAIQEYQFTFGFNGVDPLKKTGSEANQSMRLETFSLLQRSCEKQEHVLFSSAKKPMTLIQSLEDKQLSELLKQSNLHLPCFFEEQLNTNSQLIDNKKQSRYNRPSVDKGQRISVSRVFGENPKDFSFPDSETIISSKTTSSQQQSSQVSQPKSIAYDSIKKPQLKNIDKQFEELEIDIDCLKEEGGEEQQKDLLGELDRNMLLGNCSNNTRSSRGSYQLRQKQPFRNSMQIQQSLQQQSHNEKATTVLANFGSEDSFQMMMLKRPLLKRGQDVRTPPITGKENIIEGSGCIEAEQQKQIRLKEECKNQDSSFLQFREVLQNRQQSQQQQQQQQRFPNKPNTTETLKRVLNLETSKQKSLPATGNQGNHSSNQPMSFQKSLKQARLSKEVMRWESTRVRESEENCMQQPPLSGKSAAAYSVSTAETSKLYDYLNEGGSGVEKQEVISVKSIRKAKSVLSKMPPSRCSGSSQEASNIFGDEKFVEERNKQDTLLKTIE